MDMKVDRKVRRLSVWIVVGTSMSLIVPAAASLAAAEPKIAFLNPSSFAQAGERGYIVSDTATDSGPGCCDASDELFRFSAWVSGAPEGSSVFFTIVQGALDFELPAVKPAGDPPSSDTWEAGWEMPPEVLNGPATVNAYLVKDNEAIAQASVDVTIMRVSQSVDISYPPSGGGFGVFNGLANALPEKGAAERKKPIGIVDALYTFTPDAKYVRTFYTTSAPGSEPVWKACATEEIPIFGDPDDGVRCAIASAGDAASMTAVAAIVNSSPQDFDPRFNHSGDAVRVVPYEQLPTELSLDDLAEQRVGKNADADVFYCSQAITATLRDQTGRHIAGANLDVKAVGPTDGLKFHSSTVFGGPVPPDRGGHTIETGYDCGESDEEGGVVPTNGAPDLQGEHPLFGNPDVKHVESGAGTDDLGEFDFVLHANATGLTQYTVWADELDDGCHANDDRFTFGEPSAAGSIGWAADPFTTGVRTPDPVVPCSDGGPAPDPTGAPDPASRSVGIGTRDRAVPAGTKVRLAGRIRSDDAGCVSGQHVTLQARRPGRRFRALATGLSRTTGRYRFAVTVGKTREYRAVLDATETCLGARSRTIRIRAT